MKRVEVVVSAVVCLGLMVGCSAETSDTPGLTASPTTSPSSTPTPSPTAAAGPRDLSDPELGIVFTDFPRDQDETSADAIQTYMLFEADFWRALKSNVVPPGPWATASDEAIAWIHAQVDPNSANGWSATGTLKASVTVVAAESTSMTLDVCRDWREVTFVNVDGTAQNTGEIDGEPLSKVRLGLVVASSGWRVATYEPVGPC